MCLHELELVDRERLHALDLLARIRRRELVFVSGIVAKRINRALDLEAFCALDETAPVGAAAKLAVVCDFEACTLLQLQNLADAVVLYLFERRVIDRAVHMLLECLTQRGRPEQAADMIGTERRTARREARHDASPGLPA